METPLPPSGSSGVAPLWTLSATPSHAPHASPRLWPAPHPHTLCPLCVLCWVPHRSHPVPHKSSKPHAGAQPVLPGRGWLPLMQQQGAPPPAALSHGAPQSLSVGGPGAHDLWVRRGHVPRSLHPALSPALTAGAGGWRSGVRPVSCTLGFYKTGLQTGENQIQISPAAGSKGALRGLGPEGSPGPDGWVLRAFSGRRRQLPPSACSWWCPSLARNPGSAQREGWLWASHTLPRPRSPDLGPASALPPPLLQHARSAWRFALHLSTRLSP